MPSRKTKLGLLATGLMLSGCMQATTYEATKETSFKPRDKELLAKVSYVKTPVPEAFRRAIVDYHRKEAPGSIVVDSDNHYLYFVQDGGKAIRYGITVGEEAMAWSGIAKVGSKTEWPAWHPTKSEISRLGVPTFVAPGPDNPMGSRAIYLYSGGKDTLFRIHGTNQPEYIGASMPQAQLDGVVDGLRDRGLVDGAGELTDTGRETRHRVEALTDELAAPAYEALSADEVDELVAGLEAMVAA